MYVYLSKKINVPHVRELSCARWNSALDFLCVGGTNGSLRILQLSGESIIHSNRLKFTQTLVSHKGHLQKICWNVLHKKLTSCDVDGKIVVWCLHKQNFYEEMVNNRKKSTVRDLKWSNTGEKICIIYQDGLVICGTVDGNRSWSKELNHALKYVEWSPSDRTMLLVTMDNEIMVLESSSGQFVNFFKTKKANKKIRCVRWYGGVTFGHSLIVGFEGGFVELYKNELDKSPICIETEMKIRDIKWSRSGKIFAVAGYTSSKGKKEVVPKNLIRFYDEHGNHIQTLTVPSKPQKKEEKHRLIREITWDRDDLRLAIIVGSCIFFAIVRPMYEFTVYKDVLIYTFPRSGEGQKDCVVFWRLMNPSIYSAKSVFSVGEGGMAEDGFYAGSEYQTKIIKFYKHVRFIGSGDNYVYVIQRHAHDVMSTSSKAGHVITYLDEVGNRLNYKKVLFTPQYHMSVGRHLVLVSRFLFLIITNPLSKKSVGETGGSVQEGYQSQVLYHINNDRSNTDEIVAVDCSQDLIFLCRESGTCTIYCVEPKVQMRGSVDFECHVSRLFMSPDMKCLALINTEENQLQLYKTYFNAESGVLEAIEELTLAGSLREVGGEKVPKNDGGVTPDSSGTKKNSIVHTGKKDVWDFKWNETNCSMFCLMERDKLYVYRNNEIEEPRRSAGYLVRFEHLEIEVVKLDEIVKGGMSFLNEYESLVFNEVEDGARQETEKMIRQMTGRKKDDEDDSDEESDEEMEEQEEAGSRDGKTDFELMLDRKKRQRQKKKREKAKKKKKEKQRRRERMRKQARKNRSFYFYFATMSLRDTLHYVGKEELEDCYKNVLDNPDDLLWNLLGRKCLEKQNYKIAIKCFTKLKDYRSVYFINRKLKKINNSSLKMAAIHSYLGQFSKAIKIYKSLDRWDLILSLKQKIGDWFFIYRLIMKHENYSSVGEKKKKKRKQDREEYGRKKGGIMNVQIDENLKRRCFNELGTYYFDRFAYDKALSFFRKSKNVSKQIECYYFLKDYENLKNVIYQKAVNPNSRDVFLKIGKFLDGCGLEEACVAFLKAGDIEKALNFCFKYKKYDIALSVLKNPEKYVMQKAGMGGSSSFVGEKGTNPLLNVNSRMSQEFLKQGKLNLRKVILEYSKNIIHDPLQCIDLFKVSQDQISLYVIYKDLFVEVSRVFNNNYLLKKKLAVKFARDMKEIVQKQNIKEKLMFDGNTSSLRDNEGLLFRKKSESIINKEEEEEDDDDDSIGDLDEVEEEEEEDQEEEGRRSAREMLRVGDEKKKKKKGKRKRKKKKKTKKKKKKKTTKKKENKNKEKEIDDGEQQMMLHELRRKIKGSDIWRHAEAFHFLLMACRQFYQGEKEYCLINALRLTNYEDILFMSDNLLDSSKSKKNESESESESESDKKDNDEGRKNRTKELVYGLIVLMAIMNEKYWTCSNYLSKLELLNPEKYRPFSVALFLKSDKLSDRSKKAKEEEEFCTICPKCQRKTEKYRNNCGHCQKKFLVSVASGRVILSDLDHRKVWRCLQCAHATYKDESRNFAFCPLCHSPV